MDYDQVKRFAEFSAEVAVDSWRDYPSLQESISNHEQNVIDEANKHGFGGYDDIENLVEAFHAKVASEQAA